MSLREAHTTGDHMDNEEKAAWIGIALFTAVVLSAVLVVVTWK